MAGRVFGEIPGVPEGMWFPTRQALHDAGVHKPLQAGISGSEREGADSIVLSGGYEDDRDNGDVIWYIGQGGQDPDTREQVSHQLLTRQNKALALSCDKGLPVRVIRGAGHRSMYSPTSGYRYDGLYNVTEYRQVTGKSGYLVWQFTLEKAS
jgi:putative restriction endonuclease